MNKMSAIRTQVEVLALTGLFALGAPGIAHAGIPTPAPEPSSATTFVVFAVVIGALAAWRGFSAARRSKG